MNWLKESEFALKAVSENVHFLKDNYGNAHKIKIKESVRDSVTEVDLLIEKRIINILKLSNYQIMAEETANEFSKKLFDHEPYWFVDPIDGTTNYISNIPFYSCSVGLVGREGFITGAVAAPVFKEIFFCIGKNESYLNGKRLFVEKSGLENSLVCACFAGKSLNTEARSREYKLFGNINDIGRGCLRLGSAALSICNVAAGRLQAAFGVASRIWDIAGAAAVAAGAGCEIHIEQIENSTKVNFVVGCPGVSSEIAIMMREYKLANLLMIKSAGTCK
jgi:myo-inositol-1(or 4)-monophosphatase